MTERNPPQPRGEPILNVPAIALAVIAVLVVIHGALQLAGEDVQTWAVATFAFIPSRLAGEVGFPSHAGAEVWTFLTYALLHADWMHVGFNSLWLLIFSTPLVQKLGGLRYLLLIVCSAIVGAATMLVNYWGQFTVVVGASAAVTGALGAAVPILFAPGFRQWIRSRAAAHLLRAQTPKQLWSNPAALGFTAVFFALTLLSGISHVMTGTAFLEERIIAWEAHLGGFLAGFGLFYLLDRNRV